MNIVAEPTIVYERKSVNWHIHIKSGNSDIIYSPVLYDQDLVIHTSAIKFAELLSPRTKYDEQYLKELRDKAKRAWLGSIEPDRWLREIRGGYDE
jgi:hypothetical protein